MEFPFNTQKLNPDYVSTVIESAETDVLAQYAMFKKISGTLVKSFKYQINKYGSIHYVPVPVLQKYNNEFSRLFRHYNTLEANLHRQLNKNTAFIKQILHEEGSKSFFYKKSIKKQYKLNQKIKLVKNILMLSKAIEFCLNKHVI